MGENSSRALLIAGSTLIAVIIFSAVAFFFKNISNVPNQQDEQLSIEQLQKFNKEYEVYEKSAMYGVDVISCLNKAKSNNEKYVQEDGEGFLSGGKYGQEFLVNVEFILNGPLEESIEVREMNSNGKEVGCYNRHTSHGINLKNAGFIINLDEFTTFKATDDLRDYTRSSDYGSLSTKIKGGVTYAICNNDGTMNNTVLGLLQYSNNMKQVIKNTDRTHILGDEGGWTSATWSTFLYDLKTKRFKCTGITYSESTGRVEKISFEEL